MKKLTTDIFISRAMQVHGQKYDYSRSIYISAIDKIEIICPDHGSFMQKASHHMDGRGCKKCADVSRGVSNRMGWDVFVDKCNAKHEFRYEYEHNPGVTSSSKIKVKCRVHGWFEQCAATHLSGAGCNDCAVHRVSRSQAISEDEFIVRSRAAHGDRYIYAQIKMENCKDKVEIVCRVHGAFYQVAHEHYSGKGCAKCGYVSAIRKKKRSYGFYGYSRSKYVAIAESNKRGMSNLYIVNAIGNGESFVKIGISMNSVKHRFASHFPYSIESYIEIPMLAGDAWDAEKVIHGMLKLNSYKPKISFNGYTECFSCLNDESMKFISEIKNVTNIKPRA